MEEKIYPVDRNHAGIRVVVLFTLIIIFAALALGLTPLLRSFGVAGLLLVLLVGAISFTASYFLTNWLEMTLRRVWPSGRTMINDGDSIVLREKDGQTVELRWADPVDVTAWCFIVNTRRTAVPKGWYCVAIRLVQGDVSINPYAFMSERDAEQLPGWQEFEQLIPRKKGPMGKEDEHVAAIREQQLDLRVAERERWEDGAELDPPDFAELVEKAALTVNGWPRGGYKA